MQEKKQSQCSRQRLGFLKGKGHILLFAVLMIIALVVLHVVAANSIYKAGGFSLKNPLTYLMIAGFLVLFAFKFKYLRRLAQGTGKDFRK